VGGEGRDVSSPLPEGWERDLDDVQPVEQVFPEPARGDLGFEVPVGRGQDSYIPGAGPRFPNPLVHLLLEEPEQLRLQCQREIADLVQEQRPALGCGHLPFGRLDGTGERAAGVAEQFAFQQLAR
jgi:hypothetical protein